MSLRPTLVAVLAALWLSTAAASAAAVEVPPPFTQIPPAGEDARSSAAGKLDIPRAVESSPDGSRLYVSDRNERVEVFNPWGAFREAFGWGVADGANEFQHCVNPVFPETPPPGTCLKGTVGGAAGQFDKLEGLAVDGSGDLYVVDHENHRVQKFDSSGEFLLAFGGDVIVDGAAGTGTVTSGSASVTAVATTAKLFKVDQRIEGTGIVPGTTIAAVGANTITLSQPAGPSATGTTTALTTPAGPNNVPSNERQTITLGANTTGGSFTLAFTTPNPSPSSATTAAIAAGASAAEVQAALTALANVGAGNVEVSGGAGGPWTVEFKGARFADTDVDRLSVDTSGLTIGSGSKQATVTSAKAEEVCAVAAECQAGTPGTADGQFEWRLVFDDVITVGAGGTVYVGDGNRIQAFEPDGSFKSQIRFADVHAAFPSFPASGDSGSLAYDPHSGDLYLGFLQNGSGSLPYIYKLTPAGALVDVVEAIVAPGAIATEGSEGEGNVFAIEVGRVGHPVGEVIELDPSGDELGVVEEDSVNPLIALGTNRAGNLHVAAGNGGSSIAHVSIFGPPPSEIEPAPEVPPTIGEQYAISAGANGAVVKARINPHFFGATTYHVEYGAGPCSLGGCASTAEQPLGGGEKDALLPTSGVAISGLAPATIYHFRFVATSGELTVKGTGEDSEGHPLEEEGTFTTRAGTTASLPDSRAYEMVSPADKNNGEAGLTSLPLGGLVDSTELIRPLQATAGGEAISFASFGAFGDAEGGPAASQYVSRRGASGWQTENITPAANGFALRDPVRGLSPDLAHAAVVQFDPPLVPGAPEGIENLYLRNGVGDLTLLTPNAPTDLEGDYCVNFGGATPDFGKVVFMAAGALTPEAPTTKGQSLYEWTQAGGLSLLSVLPDGSPAIPAGRTGFGSRTECQSEGNALNAVSSGGERVVWTYDGSYEGASRPLFARIGGAQTVELDLSEGGIGPAGGGAFQAASEDGSAVFFTAPGKLTPDAAAGDFYRYDFAAPEGERLTDLSAGPTAAQVLGVLGASEDGRAVYFAAKGVLTEDENGEQQKAVAGKANVYRWEQGEDLGFVAALDTPVDGTVWGDRPKARTARVGIDGDLLAFVSTVPLTGFDNRDRETGKADAEVFLYDAESDELACASCSSIGARPIGSAGLPPWTTPFSQPRNLSEAGAGRLIFQSFDALAQKDVNRRQDVYQFELPGTGSCTPAAPSYSAALGGCQDLISSGESGDDSFFDDASASGADVFFATRQRLLPSDPDDHYDVYDARVGGGLPEPAPEGECAGEGCRPAPSPPSSPGSPASAAFQGPGNVKEAAKQKKHKKAKQRKRKQSKKTRPAHAQRGGKR